MTDFDALTDCEFVQLNRDVLPAEAAVRLESRALAYAALEEQHAWWRDRCDLYEQALRTILRCRRADAPGMAAAIEELLCNGPEVFELQGEQEEQR